MRSFLVREEGKEDDGLDCYREVASGVITSAPFWVVVAVVILYWLFQN